MDKRDEAKEKAQAPAQEDIFEPMEFTDVNLRQVPVTINGRRHFLVEASESDVCDWSNRKMAAVRMAKGEMVGIGKMADTDPYFLSLCLYTASTAGEPDRRVPLDDILGWSNRIVRPLVARAKKLCGVEDEADKTLAELRKERAALDARVRLLEREEADSLAEAEGKS